MIRRDGGLRASAVRNWRRRASSELSLAIGTPPIPLPPGPRRPRPPPVDPGLWPPPSGDVIQLTRNPISRGISLSERLSVHAPVSASGETPCPSANAESTTQAEA